MLSIRSLIGSKGSAARAATAPVAKRGFTVTYNELYKLDAELKRKLSALRLLTEHKDFTYEPPQMIYDKATGDVTILPKKVKKPSTIIRNYEDFEREKKALFEEMGVPGGDLDNVDNVQDNVEDVADKIYQVHSKIKDDFGLAQENTPAFSRDMFRIDVGLMIMRPPIMLHMRDPDIEMLKLRSELMNEYYCDFKKHIKEYGEVTQLNESVLANNPYASEMNLDNYPTHEYTDPQTGERQEYCAASKNFAKVDPMCDDWRSLHYAAEDRTYFLVRNKFTQEWQFPTGQIFMGQTLIRAKHNLFLGLSDGEWNIKFSGNLPQVHTLREFTVAEQEETINKAFKGVRTYYFHANHWRGLPMLAIENGKTDYDDFAWVPKRKMNEFLTRDYFEIFINACTTR